MPKTMFKIERTDVKPSAQPALVLTSVKLDDVIKSKAMNVLAPQFDKPRIKQSYQINGKPAYLLFLTTESGAHEVVIFWTRGIVNEVHGWMSSQSLPEVNGNQITTSNGNVKVIEDLLGPKALTFAKIAA